MPTIFTPTGSYRAQLTSGAVTTVAAGTATAGHILALRNATGAAKTVRIRAIEAEIILTTEFSSAQEVGFDLTIARTYTSAHTGATALDFTTGNGGRLKDTFDDSVLTGRIADSGALTAGTHTLDTNPVCRASVWCGAVGATLNRYYDFSLNETGGIILGVSMGLVGRNSILMGTAGVGRWTWTVDWEDGILSS